MALPSKRRPSLAIENPEQALDLARRDSEHIVDQLDSMCVALESGRSSVPQTPDQWRRCLKEIALGNDWEHGTWR